MRFHFSSATLAVVGLLCSFASVVPAQNSVIDYPSCAQPCLLNVYSLSACAQDTRPSCVCENAYFLGGTTSCVKSNCTQPDQDKTWNIAEALCITAKANMTLFYEGTGRWPNSTTSGSPSTTSGSSPTASAAPSKKKLSNGALAGIVVGVVIGLTLLAAGTFWFVHNWWTIEEVGPNKSYGGEMGYNYGPKHRQRPAHSHSTRSTY